MCHAFAKYGDLFSDETPVGNIDGSGAGQGEQRNEPTANFHPDRWGEA